MFFFIYTHFFFFFFNDTATTEIYTLSLHTLFRSNRSSSVFSDRSATELRATFQDLHTMVTSVKTWQPAVCWLSPKDRKSTRLNSSHSQISYAVFCLKKKTQTLNISVLAIITNNTL